MTYILKPILKLIDAILFNLNLYTSPEAAPEIRRISSKSLRRLLCWLLLDINRPERRVKRAAPYFLIGESINNLEKSVAIRRGLTILFDGALARGG